MESLSPANIDKDTCKKMFQCPECGHEFTWKSNLTTHIKTVHRGQKFKCPECDYEATQKRYLTIHLKSVHRGQKFQCPECEYEATRK